MVDKEMYEGQFALLLMKERAVGEKFKNQLEGLEEKIMLLEGKIKQMDGRRSPVRQSDIDEFRQKKKALEGRVLDLEDVTASAWKTLRKEFEQNIKELSGMIDKAISQFEA